LHTALRARARAARRRAQERQVAVMPDASSPAEPFWEDIRPVLDEELERLPARYRAPIVLCCLAGKTQQEAAGELGWSRDMVRRRMEQGQELLRQRLSRRGVAPSAALLGTFLTENAVSAVPPGWIHATIQAAFAADGASASVT